MSERGSTHLDRFDCYELCVQSPRHIVAFLRGVHGNEPRLLQEDFCGSAAVARYWLAEGFKRPDRARARAIDLDPEALARAGDAAQREGVLGRLELIHGDATRPESAEPRDGPDVIFVGNFSIGYLHGREDLVRYLRLCKARLDRGQGGFGGGVMVCDTYGGAGAFKLGGITRVHPSRGREMIRYHWVHEAADPLTGMVENSISFRIEVDGDVVAELPRAFTYCWRLWSIAELREAMHEAGLVHTQVYKDVNIAPGQTPVPVAGPRELGEDWTVLIVARA